MAEQRQSKVSWGTTLAQAPSGAGWKSQEPPLGKREAQINAAPDGTRKGNFRMSKAQRQRRRAKGQRPSWDKWGTPLARWPLARGRRLKREREPRKSAFLSLSFRFHFTAAAQPPLHRLSSQLATEENGTTLSPRRSQPNRAACFRTFQPLLQPLRFAVALRAGPGDGCDIQTASSTILLPLPHPGHGSFGSYAPLSVCGTPPTILDLLSFDCPSSVPLRRVLAPVPQVRLVALRLDPRRFSTRPLSASVPLRRISAERQ